VVRSPFHSPQPGGCWSSIVIKLALHDDAVHGVSRLYYSACSQLSSSVNTRGLLMTCDLSAAGVPTSTLVNCRRVRRASFVCVSSLVVSRRHLTLYWSDVGLGLIAALSLNASRLRRLRSVSGGDQFIATSNRRTDSINN